MRPQEIKAATEGENLEVSKGADLIIRPEVVKRVKITKDPISNDLEYLGGLNLRVEGNLEDDGGRRGLRFKIESLNPELNLSFNLKPAALERIISTHIDGELKEILLGEDFTLGPGTPKVKTFLNGIGLGIRDGQIEVRTKEPRIVKEVSTTKREEATIQEPRDKMVLQCHQPTGTLRPAYGAWCLACCAICPLPTGLIYTRLKSH
jgi:hypothetical protein